MAVVIRVMLRWSRLPRQWRRWTGMSWSPRLAAMRSTACSEPLHESRPVSRAWVAAFQRMVRRGSPVKGERAVAMTRRKAGWCRKWAGRVVRPGGGGAGGGARGGGVGGGRGAGGGGGGGGGGGRPPGAGRGGGGGGGGGGGRGPPGRRGNGGGGRGRGGGRPGAGGREPPRGPRL